MSTNAKLNVCSIATHIDPAAVVKIQSASPSAIDLSPLHDPLQGTRSNARGLFGHGKDVIVLEVFSDMGLDFRRIQMDNRNYEQVVKAFIFVGKNADTGSLMTQSVNLLQQIAKILNWPC